MDQEERTTTSHFDTFARIASRRGLLGGLSATALALAGTRLSIEVEAKKKHKNHKHKHKHKKKNQGHVAAPPPAPESAPPPPSPPPPPAPATRLDATCPEPTENAAALIPPGEQPLVAQTFTALASGPLVSARLRIIKQAGTTGSYNLQILPVDGDGVPVDDVLANAVVSNDDVPDGSSTVEFTFAFPFSVVAGTTYALVVTRIGGFQLQVGGGLGNPCAGVAFVISGLTGKFIADDNFDMSFETFVTS
jgi:hypothetical protein